jgi:hypothetical protein
MERRKAHLQKVMLNLVELKINFVGVLFILFVSRYASLYFVVFCDQEDNELIALEIIHNFVEVLDRYFVSVCELDLIFNFHKVISILFGRIFYSLFGLSGILYS